MRIFLVSLVVVLLLAASAFAVYYFFFQPKNVNDAQNATETTDTTDYKTVNTEIAQSGTSDADLEKLVAEYGSKYDASLAELRSVSPNNWTKALVDKAYLCFLYADKVGLHSQVQDLYYQIEAAKASGVDVDANSANVTQAEREAIRDRAAEAAGQPAVGEVQP